MLNLPHICCYVNPKSQLSSYTLMGVAQGTKRFDAVFVLDGQVIRAVGTIGGMSDEDFEADFYQIIGSLELTNSE